MLSLGGKELIRKKMVRVTIDFRIKRNIRQQISDAVLSLFRSQARDKFDDFRPLVENAINKGVTQTRAQFIPDDDEAAQLGVGQGGSIDTTRTLGAWTQLLTSGPNTVMRFSVRRSTSKNLIGNVIITYDENDLLNAPLSKVPTPDSLAINEIPWLRWLIRGAPTNSAFEFESTVAPGANSRTGGGIMVAGGIWRFSPARPTAFTQLNRNIEREVVAAIEQNAGAII